MLKKGARLTSTYEFNKTRRLGLSQSGEYSRVFALQLKDSNLPTRIGIVVTNKFSSIAVKRNRIKRIYRELVRKEYSKMSPGFWIVIHPRDKFMEASNEEISADLNSILQKLSVLR